MPQVQASQRHQCLTWTPALQKPEMQLDHWLRVWARDWSPGSQGEGQWAKPLVGLDQDWGA